MYIVLLVTEHRLWTTWGGDYISVSISSPGLFYFQPVFIFFCSDPSSLSLPGPAVKPGSCPITYA